MTTDRSGTPFEDVSFGSPAVRGFLHRPTADSRSAVVLTHGAGGDSGGPLLVALATAFADRGLTALRCDLPYRQARPKGPPSPSGAARDREGLKHAVLAMRRMGAGNVVLAGHSYGGRQATMLSAAEPDLADALLLLSYPLHPPGRPEQLRTAHLSELSKPVFFVHGSADAFGSLEEIERARALIPAPTGVFALDGARHDLRQGRRGPAAIQQTAERIVDAFLRWREELAPRARTGSPPGRE
jgi:uncharacterized protein